MRKFLFNKSKVLYKYLLSFIFVLIIPLFLFIYVINNSVLPAMRGQIISVNQKNLEMIQLQIEQKLDEMEKIALSIMENSRLSPYMIQQNFFKKYEGINELRRYKFANDFIYDILFYVRGDVSIYSAYQSWDLKSMIGIIYPFEKWKYEEVYNDINSLERPVIRPAEKISSEFIRDLEVVSYIYPIKPYEPYATIVFLINNEKLKELLSSNLGNFNENIYILDGNNQLITSSKREDDVSNEQFQYILENIFKQPGSKHTFMLPGEEYLVSSIKSSKNNWLFISVVRNKKIMEEVNKLKLKVSYTVLIVFIIGLFLITIAAYINYLPLYKLQKKVTRYFTIKDEGKDEIKNMDIAFNQMLETNKVLKQNTELYKQILREYLLKELIEGKVLEADDMIKVGNEVDLHNLMHGSYQVVIFKFLNTDIKRNYTKCCKYIHSMIENCVDKQDIKIYSINSLEQNQLIEVLNINTSKTEQLDNRICSLMKGIVASVLTKLNVCVIAGIGNVYDEIFSLGKSYAEASQSLQFHLFEEDDYVFVYKKLDIKKLYENIEYINPYNDLRKLSAQIDLGNIENTEEILSRLLKMILKENIPEFWHKLNDPAETSLWKLRPRTIPYERVAYPMVYFTPERQKQITALNADIGAYVDQMIARFITGDVSIEKDWDEFINTLNNMRVDELLKIYQDTYDELMVKQKTYW
jgi:two-component system response regulator YesN